MAEGKYHRSEQIIELALTETYDSDRMAIDQVILEATAAGTFVFMIGTVSLSFFTVATNLGKCLPLYRSANHVELVSGPANGKAYVLLEKKK